MLSKNIGTPAHERGRRKAWLRSRPGTFSSFEIREYNFKILTSDHDLELAEFKMMIVNDDCECCNPPSSPGLLASIPSFSFRRLLFNIFFSTFLIFPPFFSFPRYIQHIFKYQLFLRFRNCITMHHFFHFHSAQYDS